MGYIDENSLTRSRLCLILKQHCIDNNMNMYILDGHTIKISLSNIISNSNASQFNSNQQTRTSFYNDVRLVQSQTNCTEGEAINALNMNNGDIVDAIMHLTI